MRRDLLWLWLIAAAMSLGACTKTPSESILADGCTSPWCQLSGALNSTSPSLPLAGDDEEATELPLRQRPYTPPCPATPGERRSCTVDRLQSPGYTLPAVLPLEGGPAAEPMVQAAIGNLAGGSLDGIVFSEWPAATPTEAGGQNPGYLCAINGTYGPCPSDLGLPHVDGQVMALALEYIDSDKSPDLLIAAIESVGDQDLLMDVVAQLYAGTAHLEFHVYLFSQIWDESDAWPHWVDRTAEVGLSEPLMTSCAPANVQLLDVNGDGATEVVFGGYNCPPIAYTWDENHRLVHNLDLLPNEIGSNTGIWTTPREDGSQNLFMVSYDGFDRGNTDKGGSSCWRGEPGNWSSVDCPAFGGSPMGVAFPDIDDDGKFDVASSDVSMDHMCAWSMGEDPFHSIACFDESWALPDNNHTLAGESWHNVSWAVGAWDDFVVYVEGYEHPLEPHPDRTELVPWTEWPQQLHLYTVANGNYTRVHDPVVDANVQERGLLSLTDIDGNGCVDPAPLPVGLTPMRIISDGTCAAGTQQAYVRIGNQGAYGTQVTMIGGGEDERRKAALVTSGHGTAGFGPPTVSIPPWVEKLEVRWTTGDTTEVARNPDGRFPSVIQLNASE